MGWERTERVIGACIEVHRGLGPGLLESAYEQCLAYELSLRGIEYERQVDVPVIYKGVALERGYRVDFVIERQLLLEVKAVEHLAPVHEAQVITYLRLLRIPAGSQNPRGVGQSTRGGVGLPVLLPCPPTNIRLPASPPPCLSYP